MSNPQMLMHHLEPLPSRGARHEQKFWLPRSFFPRRACGVQAYDCTREANGEANRLCGFAVS